MLPLENLTVGALLRRTAAACPERPAVICRDETISYREFDTLVDGYSSALLRRGVKQGEHIGILGEADALCVALFFAVQRIGAVAVMLGTSMEVNDLKTVMDLADVSKVYTGCSFIPGRELYDVACAVEGLPLLQEIEAFYGQQATLVPDTEPEYSELGLRESSVTPQDTAVILFTSGSTGVPKAVMTSHYSRVNGGIQQGGDFRTTCEDIFCVALPIFHCFSISTNIMASVAYGACLCLPKDRHTASILYAVQTYRCTILHSVPTLFRAMISRPDFAQWDISSLRTGIMAGSGYPPEDFDKVEKLFGMALLSSLGQTEATAGLTVAFPEEDRKVRIFTVGHFMDHVEGKIVDIATGKTLPVNEVGEICVRGYLVMQGYYKNPEATQKAIDKDGWLHTGDLAALDKDGNLVMKGRIKELIIRGGENISPAEIENELVYYPQIYTSKVVGVPDSHYGEEACACIILNKGEELSEDTIRDGLKTRLSAYKIPRYILFFDSFPMNATGKIKSRELALEAARRLGI